MAIAPTGSNFGRCEPRVSGSQRSASTTAISPIGTFTRKIGRHVQWNRFASSSTPPSTCPATEPMPIVAPNQAIARGRSCTG